MLTLMKNKKIGLADGIEKEIYSCWYIKQKPWILEYFVSISDLCCSHKTSLYTMFSKVHFVIFERLMVNIDPYEKFITGH